MLRSVAELERYTVTAIDGDAGSILTFLLDDARWVVRCLLVQTGAVPGGRRQVVVPPAGFREVDALTRRFHVALTREGVRTGPGSALDCLRADEVRGYHLEGSDGHLGCVEDAFLDDETWTVRYLVVDTSPWLVGRRVLVAPQWATRVDWADRKVSLGVPRQALEAAPVWTAGLRPDRAYEVALHQHHGRPAYWEEERRRAWPVPLSSG